jgi:hypothetical protein
VLASTAELPVEQMAVETPRVRAIETKSWRPPEILDENEQAVAVCFLANPGRVQTAAVVSDGHAPKLLSST